MFVRWKTILRTNNGIDRSISGYVLDGCTIIWENEVFMFGGPTNRLQILAFRNCTFEPVAMLNFEFDSGACHANKFVYLCFDKTDSTKCRYATG